MFRIEAKFKDLLAKKKKAFIAFITAGYPSLAVTEKLILEFSSAGVDIVELGVPFSDPMADGPVIQESSFEALKKRTNLKDILKSVKKVRKSTQMPICLMTYYNPIFIFGEEKFVKEAFSSGVDGVIVPDLPPEEGKSLIRLCNKYGLENICFIAPTTSVPRMKRIAGTARGFIYYVSLTGVTGARRALPLDMVRNLKTIKRFTSKPVCVGFGVSTNAQVRQVKKIADGVIIGSAIVKKIKENIGKPDLVRRVGNFVRSLKQ
ncbi:MAG: tryptophan synthase subunit alpha [Candidatus Omnitrophica bacterium]|nr:tryptophan synthase subunit alpha [Candidatus Omnitrophota bacterium]